MFILDTNVVSELMKSTPDPQVNRWIKEHNRNEIAISVITIGEIVYGFHIMSEGKRKTRLDNWFEVDFMEWIQGRIFPLDETTMRIWAEIKAKSRPLPVVDSLLAATALAAGATMVTRNTKDFEPVEGLPLINPWQ